MCGGMGGGRAGTHGEGLPWRHAKWPVSIVPRHWNRRIFQSCARLGRERRPGRSSRFCMYFPSCRSSKCAERAQEATRSCVARLGGVMPSEWRGTEEDYRAPGCHRLCKRKTDSAPCRRPSHMIFREARPRWAARVCPGGRGFGLACICMHACVAPLGYTGSVVSGSAVRSE